MTLIQKAKQYTSAAFNRVSNMTTKAYVYAETASEGKTKRAKRINQFVLLAGLLMIASPSMANDFSGFKEAIEDFAGGNFAIGISILALVLGALMGLGKMTVWPALTGFAVAAVFAIGPYMIVQIFEVFKISP